MKYLVSASLLFFSLQGYAQKPDNLYVDGVIIDTLNSMYGRTSDMPSEKVTRVCSIFGRSRGGYHKWGKYTFQEARAVQTGAESYTWNVTVPYRCQFSYRHFEACTGLEGDTVDIDETLEIRAVLTLGDDNILRTSSIQKTFPAMPGIETFGSNAMGTCGDAIIDMMNRGLNGLHISE